MTERRETLTDLVNAVVGRRSAEARTGNRLTFDEFAERAVHPASCTRVSAKVAWKVSQGERVIISPDIIAAFAAGLGMDLERVQRAAAWQFAGYAPVGRDAERLVVGHPFADERLAGAIVTAVHAEGVTAEELALVDPVIREALADMQHWGRATAEDDGAPRPAGAAADADDA